MYTKPTVVRGVSSSDSCAGLNICVHVCAKHMVCSCDFHVCTVCKEDAHIHVHVHGCSTIRVTIKCKHVHCTYVYTIEPQLPGQ